MCLLNMDIVVPDILINIPFVKFFIDYIGKNKNFNFSKTNLFNNFSENKELYSEKSIHLKEVKKMGEEYLKMLKGYKKL